jgi:lipoprotein-releasing system ATP-binding protein
VSEEQESRREALLRAENVFKNYRIGRKTIEVLHGVDFILEAQGFVAIHGASGAGKSTLLHVLGGLDTPDSGDVWFSGQSFRSMKRSRLSRFRNDEIGFIFQAYHLFPEFSALENVCLPGRIARRSVAELTTAGGKLLELVGLKDRMDHRPYELSGGEQQRVAIARALINNPSLVLADEPTGNLDSKTGKEITALLEQLREDLSIALVLATHDLTIGDRADRVVHLVDGKMQLNV